ncbi:family 16 glycosylhydrolase [Lysobacter sp. CA196]|uniref:family 16 glycosylhydrolase n=1 Tax=Lysobacter sp. CA196 TaxID=3455606 RepID=UPI003F8D0EAC
MCGTDLWWVDNSIYVINLERQPDRMADMLRELDRLTDAANVPLANRVIRFPAVDGRGGSGELTDATLVNPTYTLGAQLFVEPQPRANPDLFDLSRPIQMTRAEIAIAYSHIGVWRKIAQSNEEYALVLEDDVWFEYGFGRTLNDAWREATTAVAAPPHFDILYVSYQEVRHGAPKELIGKCIFRPRRGLWFLSGYILSRRGAQALLDALPCEGPVDLWINHKFESLLVLGLRRPLVHQRRDLHSTNSYSILPSLARIGVLEGGDASLFHRRPVEWPVFAFGAPGSGLSALAMALSMLGYRCCSDFSEIPPSEFNQLMTGGSDRVFDAYVNIESLTSKLPHLRQTYPHAKFIILSEPRSHLHEALLSVLGGADVLHLTRERASNWNAICEHLRMAPPDALYPSIDEIGLRTYVCELPKEAPSIPTRQLQFDTSPWVASPRAGWSGLSAKTTPQDQPSSIPIRIHDDFTKIQPTHWLLRNDTFPGNLGLFRPANIALSSDRGLSLSVLKESLGVRALSAGAISSRAKFLFGRFEATLQAVSARGVVTGFFLHRDSPRQEIDVEIPGNRPDCLLVNVFYNPGDEGSKYDYGYRGAPVIIELGFDASKSFHHYAIEWDPCEIRWFVDDQLVHRRVIWDPTPIPHLPMTLHLNTWPSRSAELAGRLALRSLPVSAFVRNVFIGAHCVIGEVNSPEMEIACGDEEHPST